jgi:ribonuclease HI
METIFIYSDASFSKTYDLAVIGYISFSNALEHKRVLTSEVKSDVKSEYQFINIKNNIRAEIRAAITALQSCRVGSRVQLFSDCSGVCDLLTRRKKLEQGSFISKKTGKHLANASLYQEFFSICDSLDLDIQWVKGHSSVNRMNNIHKNFSHLDQQVRKKLRKVVTMINSATSTDYPILDK